MQKEFGKLQVYIYVQFQTQTITSNINFVNTILMPLIPVYFYIISIKPDLLTYFKQYNFITTVKHFY